MCCLFESVEAAYELHDMAGAIIVTFRLSHIDDFGEVTI